MHEMALLAAGLVVGGPALAAEPTTSLFHRFEFEAGADAAGPLLFRDPPDRSLDAPTVAQYGARLGFRFGATGSDPNRVGVEVGYHSLARAGDRTLAGVDPELVVASGGDTEVQLGVGARIALADPGFLVGGRAPFTGPMASLALRHAFLDDDAKVPAGVVLGGFVDVVLGAPATYTTAFAGARLDFTIRKAS